MPFEQGLGFDDQQSLFPMRCAAGQHDEQTTVDGREGCVFHVALQNDELLTQERVFRHEFRPEPDQIRCGCFDQGVGGRLGPAFKVSVSGFHYKVQRLSEDTQEAQQQHRDYPFAEGWDVRSQANYSGWTA